MIFGSYTSIILLPIAVILLRIGVSWSNAQKGWANLVPRFSEQSDPAADSQEMRMASMRVGRGTYKNCVNIIYNSSGMHLQLLSFYRMFHPSLFIPWSQVGYDASKNPISFDRHVITIGSPAMTQITLNDRNFAQLKQYID